MSWCEISVVLRSRRNRRTLDPWLSRATLDRGSRIFHSGKKGRSFERFINYPKDSAMDRVLDRNDFQDVDGEDLDYSITLNWRWPLRSVNISKTFKCVP
jgi:hypothetical protein